MRKNPFQDDGVTFVNDPGQVVGLALAANAAHDELPHARTWLLQVLQDPQLRPATVLLGLFQEHARRILGATTALRVDNEAAREPVEAACLHWVSVSTRNIPPAEHDALRQLQSRLLSSILLADVSQHTATRAALLLKAVSEIVTASVDEILLSDTHVGVLLGRFETAMRQWRHDSDDHDHPIRWPITSEREIQNILLLMLRPVFDDLIDKPTLRKLGHSTYRADFAIPSLGLLIEAKYARKASDFKAFEKEIYEDYIAYLSGNPPYRKMAVFIYDESSSVQEHQTTRNTLLELPDITDVIIASRPSHVPKPPRNPRHTRGQNAENGTTS
jgi:hypothetical protein